MKSFLTMKNPSLFFTKLLFLISLTGCFLIIIFGASVFKYIIFALSLLAIICSYKTVKFNLILPKKIALPWLPWIICTIFLMFIHGTKSLSKFPNAFLVLCLIFVVLTTLEIKRKNLTLCLSVGLFALDTAVSVFLFKYGLCGDILGVNKNPLFAVITIINATIISIILLDRKTYNNAECSFIFLTILFTFLTTILAQTRHVLLAYLACGCVFLLFAPKEEKKIGVYFFLIFIFMIVSFLLTGRLQQGVADLVQYSQGNTNTSWGLRLEMWRMALLAFPEAPILGWGDDAAQAMEKAGIVPPLSEWYTTHFHNDFLNGLTMGGLVMAGGWVCTLICLTQNSLKDLPRLCSLASIVAAGLVDRDWYEQDVLFPFVILWTLMYLTDSSRKGHFV